MTWSMLWARLLKCRSGTTAIEYGLILGLIFLAILTGFGVLQNNLNATYTNIAAKISN